MTDGGFASLTISSIFSSVIVIDSAELGLSARLGQRIRVGDTSGQRGLVQCLSAVSEIEVAGTKVRKSAIALSLVADKLFLPRRERQK